MVRHKVNLPLLGCLACTVFLIGNVCKATDDFTYVAPTDEIVIIDPRVDSEGKPKPVILSNAAGGQQVDIPPTVIVHNFYYTGDRDFQGPQFQGGPSVIVVTNPTTNEKLHIEVQMLPGSPRVTYRKNYIDYDFGESAIRINFTRTWGLLHRRKPSISYRKGKSLTKKIALSRERELRNEKNWLERTGVPHVMASSAKGVQAVAYKTADGIHLVGETIAAPVITVMNATPIGSLFKENAAKTKRNTRESDRFTNSVSSGF